jgi:serpin B
MQNVSRFSRHRLALLIGICSLLLLCLALHAADLTGAQGSRGSSPTVGARAILAPASATGVFGLDLLDAQPPGNAVISPDSVATVLAMVGGGAGGATASQIAQVLHLKGPTAFASMGKLQRRIAASQVAAGSGRAKAPTLGLANSLFLQTGYPLKPTFLSDLQQHFGAAPEALDFATDPAAAVDAINNWASDHTGGIIPDLLTSIPTDARMVLASAVYLKAYWRHPFDSADTYPAPFFRKSRKTQAEFMHQTERMRYVSGRDYKAVELPYRASRLSLLVMLPAGKSLSRLQRDLGRSGLGRVVRRLSPKTVQLSLPRFHLSTKVDLKSVLKSLGMPLAFSDSADFSGMAAVEGLKISKVDHVADLSVDEEGTVAAAATGITMVPVSAEGTPRDLVTFTANRPFLFFLRDRESGAVLFAGRLVAP